MLFDTHAHFDAREGEQGYVALLERARAAGVSRVLAVGGGQTMNSVALQAAAEFPDLVRAAVGLDRDAAGELGASPMAMRRAVDDVMRQIRGAGGAVAALGEIGLDFHYCPETAEAQVALLRDQLRAARFLELPVVIHSRNADVATLAELRAHAAEWPGAPERIGVLHCFTEGEAFARDVLALGFHIGFSGIVTFHNADSLRAVAATIPAERLLLETDTPYLTPIPLRGRRNEPAFVRHVAETLARVRGTSAEELARLTAANADRLFCITVR